MKISRNVRQRLLWQWRHAHDGGLRPRLRTVTLGQLEDSGRPLLFSVLPRMLRGDGSAPQSLQRAFRYVGRDRVPAHTVSRRRWSRALATSRKLAARRAARGRDP